MSFKKQEKTGEKHDEPFIFQLWNEFVRDSSHKALSRLNRFFNHTESINKLMKYMYKTKEFKEAAEKLTVVLDRKDYNEAVDSYYCGNEEFKKGNHKTALECYSNSVIYAPLEPDTLARGYAGRARVLFMIGQYEACMKEVDRAFKNGYAGDRQDLEKLRLLADIHLTVDEAEKNEFETARNLSRGEEPMDQDYSDTASISTLVENNIPEIRLARLSKCCREEIALASGNDLLNQNLDLKYRHLFNRKEINEPDLALPNEDVPCLTSAANIDYDELKGRILMANRGIYPGEVLITEPTFAYAPNFESIHENCSLCGLATVAPVPCPTCTYAVFCNEKCLLVAMNRFHALECRVLSLLYKLHPTGILVCLARMLLEKRQFAIVQYLFKTYYNEVIKNPKLIKDKKGFDPEGKYQCSDMRSIYNLEHNFSDMTQLQLAESCFQSLILMEIIVKGTYFAKQKNEEKVKTKDGDEDKEENKDKNEEKIDAMEGEKKDEETESIKKEQEIQVEIEDEEKNVDDIKSFKASDALTRDKLKLCLVLFKLVIVAKNGFSQNSAYYDSKKQKIKVQTTGGYFAPLHSLLSHSCVPNAIVSDYGRMKILRAIRYIQEGEELTINYSYGEAYKTVPLEERRKVLKDYFNFFCMCELCRKGDLTGVCSLKVACPHCKLELAENGCGRCLENVFEIPHYIKVMADLDRTHFTAKELIKLAPTYKAKVSTSHVLLEGAELKDIMIAQEWLKHFTTGSSDEFRKITNKIEKNYQIRAYHTHDRKVK